jgi:tetratricopeptide (TPR) repeat protein
MKWGLKISLGLLALGLQAPIHAASNAIPNLQELKKMEAAFAPVPLQVDIKALSETEKKALAHIIQAAQIMDGLYLNQVWAGNSARLLDLLRDKSELGQARVRMFSLYKGPWIRLEHNRPFLPDVPEKPEEANFYPAGTSKQDIEKWMTSLSPADREKAQGFFTVIRRDAQGKFTSVGYHVEYQKELALAADHLLKAAALTKQPTLKTFLTSRAKAFQTNDYYESEVAWMKLDASIEPTIGPYEVYEDGWFNAKAAFEAFVTLRDEAETAKLAKYEKEMQDLENRLPIDPKYRNPKLGALAPIKVVNSIYSSGDASRGVQTAAFNLPNDVRVSKEMGTKRTMLKNIQEAKFEKILVPITKAVLTPEDQKAVTFEAFFTHILMHEVMHGLGPHSVHQSKDNVSVRTALQDAYSAIEEAKADISGLWAMQQLIDKGVMDKKIESSMYITFLASTFRSIRFGLNEAHGRGIALQLNTLLDAGAFTVDKNGLFAVDKTRIKDAVSQLTKDLMELQATGDYKKAQDWLKRMVVLRPEVKKALDRLGDTPVDIAPQFITADQLVQQYGS